MKKLKKKKSPNPRGNPSTLTPGRPGKLKPPPVVPASWDTFCIQYKLFGKAKQAAARAGFHPDYGALLLRNPRIIARLKEIDQAMLDNALTVATKEKFLHEDLMDERLVAVIESHPHERRGYADVVSAIRHGNELLGRVASGKTTINNSATAQAAAGVGISARRLYLPVWRKEVVEKLQDTDERNQENTGTNVLSPGQ